eukprot:COSAG05_NODE_8948_length_659_cov_0.942857_2_plen_39_part_01
MVGVETSVPVSSCLRARVLNRACAVPTGSMFDGGFGGGM